MNSEIKLLIVDDSALFRNAIATAVKDHPKIRVVGMARDPYEARDKIIALKPDVMTLDVEMPRMNGIEFLRILMPQHPMRVVVISSLDGIVFDAMNAGAVDFICKPSTMLKDGLAAFSREIVDKVVVAASATLQRGKRPPVKAEPIKVQASVPMPAGSSMTKGLIAIGASTGGTEATSVILKKLPANMPGIVVTQHMPPVFTQLYANRLDKECALSVKEAEHGDVVQPGHAYIAPGDQHMLVEQSGDRMIIKLNRGEKVNGHCPSVDVMFQSVAKLKEKQIGVILTGMGADGAQGLLEMKMNGAYTIGQDESTCVVYGMPMVAQKIGAVMTQAPIDRIADMIIAQAKKMNAMR